MGFGTVPFQLTELIVVRKNAIKKVKHFSGGNMSYNNKMLISDTDLKPADEYKHSFS